MYDITPSEKLVLTLRYLAYMLYTVTTVYTIHETVGLQYIVQCAVQFIVQYAVTIQLILYSYLLYVILCRHHCHCSIAASE